MNRKKKHLMKDTEKFIYYITKLKTEDIDWGIFHWEYFDIYLPLLKKYGYKNSDEAIEELSTERSHEGKIKLLTKRLEDLIDNKKR